MLSLETRRSAVTERADVVLPVATVAEKSGTFVDGKAGRADSPPRSGRPGCCPNIGCSPHSRGNSVWTSTATAPPPSAGSWPTSRRGPAPARTSNRFSRARPRPGRGEAVLASWRMLLDAGRLQDNEPHLAGTARTPVVRLSAATAAEIGAQAGGRVAVSSLFGSITLPLVIDDLPDRVVWIPMNPPGSQVYRTLRAGVGAGGPDRPGNGPRRDARGGEGSGGEGGAMTTQTIATDFPELSGFGHDPWWLVPAKRWWYSAFSYSPCWWAFCSNEK